MKHLRPMPEPWIETTVVAPRFQLKYEAALKRVPDDEPEEKDRLPREAKRKTSSRRSRR